MPKYEFLCEACGPFEQWRDYRESREPMFCPSCSVLARRVYSAPNVAATSRAGAKTRQPNDQGPKAGVVERPRLQEPTPPPRPQRVGGRPWQISH